MTSTLARYSLVLRHAAVAVCLLLVCFAGPAAAQDGEADLELFYTELEPHGTWFEHPRYGYVWAPEVEAGWRPYARGSWAYTEENGWYWNADEEWGWAPFHYGRWFYDNEFRGWVWVPGTEWSPAWVSWRYTDDYVGWAPLPPEAEWDGGEVRYSGSVLSSPDYWMFVPAAALVSVGVYRHFVPSSRARSLMVRSRTSPSITVTGGRIFNRGFDVRRWERVSGRSIAPMRLNIITNAREFGSRRGPGSSGLYIYRPRFSAPPPDRRGPPGGPPRRTGDGAGPRGPGRIGYSPMPPPKSPGLIAPDTKRKGADRGRPGGASGPPAIVTPPAVRTPGTPSGPGGPLPAKGAGDTPKGPPTFDGRPKGPRDARGSPSGDTPPKTITRPPPTGAPPTGPGPSGPGGAGPGKARGEGPPPSTRRAPPKDGSTPPTMERSRGPSGEPAFKGPPRGPDGSGPPRGPGGPGGAPPKGPDASGSSRGPGGPGGPPPRGPDASGSPRGGPGGPGGPGGSPPRGPGAAGAPKGPPPGGPPAKKDEKKDDKKGPPPA